MVEERPDVPGTAASGGVASGGVASGGAASGEAASGEAASGGAATGELAREVLDLMRSRQQTLAVAESLTGGLVCAAFTDVPGASVVVRGGVVAYATDLKAVLLGVPRELLERYGAVHPDVAAAMADGARRRLGAELGVATTGVAGPDPQDGQPVGTVHIAVAAEGDMVVRTLALPGDRAAVRAGTVAAALRLLLGLLLGRIREDTS
jgi:nicotinamide-nucleotide amidase